MLITLGCVISSCRKFSSNPKHKTKTKTKTKTKQSRSDKKNMKKTLLTLALTAICAGAFAQGKINMVNDSTRLIYMASTAAADAALLNTTPTLGGVLPSGATLMVDLYGGTSAGSMTLQQTTTMNAIAGGFGPKQIISANLAGGTVYTFQVQVRDSLFATAAAAQAGNAYYGSSAIFTMKPSSGLAYNAINNPAAAASASTWAPGAFVLGGGKFGAIPVNINIVPEPTSMVLAGLGAASLLLFRRRS